MMEKNVELLNATMDWIKANPKLHDQGDWVEPGNEACETTMCFAGHATILAGGTFDRKIYERDYDWTVDAETGQHQERRVYSLGCGCCDETVENQTHVANFAAKKLGLNPDEQAYLFHGGRSLEELEEAVKKFSEGYTVDWDWDDGVWKFLKKEEI